MSDDEIAPVHPTHAARPVGCWTPKQQNLAIEDTSGPPAHQYPRRDRSGNRADPYDRSRNDRRDVDYPVAGIAVGAVPLDVCIHVFLGTTRAITTPKQ